MSEIGDYKPNSYKSKEEAAEQSRKVEKVVTGNVKLRKKSEIQKLSNVFLAEDMSSVGKYVVTEVLIPAFKKAVSDIVTNGIDMLLYGSNGRTNKSSGGASYVSYNKYSGNRDDNASRTRTGYNYDDVVLESRGEAEEVLTRMDEIIETYGMVSVADMYDLVGKTCAYTDNKYGWTNIRNAEPIRVRDGYLLKMPKALPIK